MKDQQSYFEKADFQSNLPKQFLVMFVAVLLVLLEVGLAQWPFFYGASPLLSLIFMYFIMIYHDELMPIMTVFIMGLIADFLMSDILGGRATALMLLSYAMRVGVLRLQQSDFMDLWVGFAVSCTAVMLFQLIVFTVVHFAGPVTYGTTVVDKEKFLPPSQWERANISPECPKIDDFVNKNRDNIPQSLLDFFTEQSTN